MRIAALLLALLLAAPAGADPSVGEPIVYPSTDPQGAPPPSLPVAVEAVDGQQLALFIDYENSPDKGMSQGGSMCLDADGDEPCGFDVLLEMTTDTASFGPFSAADPMKIVGHVEPATPTSKATLRVNGVDISGLWQDSVPQPLPGGPVPIGTLELNAAGANQLQIKVRGMHRVGAAGQLDAIQERVIVQLPEPGRGLLLASGLLALAALQRLRQRRGAST
jgi:hypothetical protein